ncbi:hypothetical protein C9374_009063 [Naegleria lovaniensis]|uniref:Uncharacterized protein n=1 Tax=Naegleria lovaniensis TaxID=51637 RepID=A0AA88KEJ0_NAELO|nr:uncharacterized protein C9374_009063 [Naegleria lovaniensis]KAG2377547.1 hypothetical protein C9374_009063 [Naegleria lovaniensis]
MSSVIITSSFRVPAFCEIPEEVFHCQIFIHFDYVWMYRVFRLVCKHSDRIVTRNSFSSVNELKVFLDNNVYRTRSFIECCEKGYFQHVKSLRICGGRELSQLSKDMDLIDVFDDDSCCSLQRLDTYLNCFPNLQKLQLDKRYFDDSIVKGMINCQNLKNLTHLDLFSARIHDKSISLIVSNPLFSNLTCLRMNQILGKECVKRICSSPYLSNLRDLQLLTCKIGDAGLYEISQSTTLKQLTALDLYGNDISFDGVKYIEHSSVFNNLISLNLQENNIPTEGIEYLATCKNLSNLEEFKFGRVLTAVSIREIIAIFNGPMKKSRSLLFSPSSDAEFEQFISCKNISSLKSLDMNCCCLFSNHGLTLLTNCENLSQLETLRIGYTKVTNFMPLITSKYLKNLTALNVSGQGTLTSSTLLELSKAFPKLKVLDFAGNDGISMDSILQSLDHLKYLEVLYLPNIDWVSPEKIQQFASHPVMARLTHLTCTNKKNDFIMNFFGEFSQLENLTYLNMRGQPLSVEEVQVLASTPKLRNLRYLFLPRGCPATPLCDILKKSPYLYGINDGERNHLEGLFY